MSNLYKCILLLMISTITYGNTLKFSEKEFVKNVKVFAQNLTECKETNLEFKHPFTQELLERKIGGMQNGKCLYIENMPGGGQMTCNFSKEYRIAVSKFILEYAKKGSAERSVSNGSIKHKIGGREVENPFQSAFNHGICNI